MAPQLKVELKENSAYSINLSDLMTHHRSYQAFDLLMSPTSLQTALIRG